MQKWEYKVTRRLCYEFDYERFDEEHIEEKKALGWSEGTGSWSMDKLISGPFRWDSVVAVAWDEHLEEMARDLNRMGNEGWELVKDVANALNKFESLQYWKRPIEE